MQRAERVGGFTYSDDILSLLKEKGINTGDTVRLETDGLTVEGELMPKTEAGSPDTIILKLKSGYNAGFLYTDKTRVTKLSEREAPVAFPFAKPRADKSLPDVTVLWTGGTIGSKIEYKTGGVFMSVKPEELLYYVPELAGIANISLDHLFSTSSEDLTHIEWQRIAERAASALNGGARGVVITHGTDTMHYTAAALSFMLPGLNAPVVLTGSQRSSDRGSSDAFLNLMAASCLAARSDIAEVGICMHASSSDDRAVFLRGTKVRKMHTSRRDAFRPINCGPIAYVERTGEISYVSDRRLVTEERKRVEAKTRFDPGIAIVKAYPGSYPDVIDYYVSKGCKGVIIEGTGLGHTPVEVKHDGKSWLPAIKRAVDSGVIVGMTSQCIYGRVHELVYKALRLLSGAGVVYCEDMLPETAYVKLGWLLGNYPREKARELLNQNIAGEINNRLIYDEFLI